MLHISEILPIAIKWQNPCFLNVGNDLISDHRALESHMRVYTSVRFQYPNGANAEKQINLGCFSASGTFYQNMKKARLQEVGQLCTCQDKNKSKRTFQI